MISKSNNSIITKGILHVRLKHFAMLSLVLFLYSCGPQLPDEVELAMADLPEKLDFNIHVKPVLSDRCFACHGPDQANQKAGLRLDLEESAFAVLPENPGKYAIKPGKLSSSQIFHRIVSNDPEEIMPPAESDLTLSPLEKAILIRWIKEGAEYKPHWAFLKPERPELPKVKSEIQVNEIDHFIQQKIAQKGWTPAPQADKETLLRRLSFDLTGLPPGIEEMDAFLADDSADAYEKVVDRMLASPSYGERMGTDWMDVARFADTHGYTVDRYRDMSPWRDWVIEAFNENMPFDQFAIWQLAGDLLPNPSKEQILATAFNRNHQQNMEGGIVEEEFRVEYVADRTNTLGAAFLGLTMECARCHDHKFDPITQENYYQLFSFFNNVQEAGQISWDDAMPVPTMLLKDEELEEVILFVNENIENKEQEIKELDASLDAGFTDWLTGKRLQKNGEGRFPKGMIAHYNLDSPNVFNRLAPNQKGEMKQQHVSTKIEPVLQEGKNGKGLLLDGDAWLDLGSLGNFDRSRPFSIGIWVNIPANLKNGVLFHKGIGAALYNFRGYHLALKDNRLEILMAHTAPYNAIMEYVDEVPRNQWIHLMMTYDGSSIAAGLKVYLDDKELQTKVESDHLFKSILFHGGNSSEPGLQIGARWRGIGAKGTIVDDITVFDRELTTIEALKVFDENKFEEFLLKPTNDLSQVEKEQLRQYYIAKSGAGRTKKLQNLQALRLRYNQAIDTVQEVMVMQEMEQPRQSYILERGQYDVHADSVFPNTPESLLPMSEDLPKNRLGLAKWLFHPDHPTTSRVAINRFWQQFFGRGLVRTSEDFGNQGEMPSHPELLDWLALEFIESGWDIKKMAKLIVMSATYRQSSKTSTVILEEDPNNVFLARGPSMRLTAEMLRDNALAASGLLVGKIGGKSVNPYQPEGLWRINGTAYRQDSGDKLYRRSMYTIWKRTVPHPTLGTFDAPSRDNCTVRRQKTSTPLQALVLLNDPVYVEAAKVIGQKISKTEDVSQGIHTAFRELTGRQPTAKELDLLRELYVSEREKFSKQPEKLKGWLSTGDYVLDQNIEPEILAANTVVASTIINADATIIKR